MNLEKVVFAFFIMLALTLNFGFFIGDLTDPVQHSQFELFGAMVVSIIATVLKMGDRTHVGAVLLATSLVADLQLIAASLVWGITVYGMGLTLDASYTALIVSLSGGALLANVVSVIILIVETGNHRF